MARQRSATELNVTRLAQHGRRPDLQQGGWRVGEGEGHAPGGLARPYVWEEKGEGQS